MPFEKLKKIIPILLTILLFATSGFGNEKEYFTIITGSFKLLDNAKTSFRALEEILSEEQKAGLRIEMVGGFYTVRVGAFTDQRAAEKLMDAVSLKFKQSKVFSAYIKPERIVYGSKEINFTPPYKIEQKDSHDKTASVLKNSENVKIQNIAPRVKKKIVNIENKYASLMDNPALRPKQYYTIQLGSFSQKEFAMAEFDRLEKIIGAEKSSYLRIENIQGYHTVRLGKFKNLGEVGALYDELRIKKINCKAIKAYIRPERIVRINDLPDIEIRENKPPQISSASIVKTPEVTKPATLLIRSRVIFNKKRKRKSAKGQQEGFADVKSAPGDKEYFTLQISSFNEIALALIEYERIVSTFLPSSLNHLRIEFVKGFFAVRAGKFKTRDEAEKLKKLFVNKYPQASILYAYIIAERIQKKYDSAGLNDDGSIADKADRDDNKGVQREEMVSSGAEETKEELSGDKIVEKKKEVISELISTYSEAQDVQSVEAETASLTEFKPEEVSLENKDEKEEEYSGKDINEAETDLPLDKEKEKLTVEDDDKEEGDLASIDSVHDEESTDIMDPDGNKEKDDSSHELGEDDNVSASDTQDDAESADDKDVEGQKLSETDDTAENQELIGSGSEDKTEEPDLLDDLLAEVEDNSEFSYEVLTVLKNDDNGENIKMPSALFFDRFSDELYLVNGINNRIIVYGPDYFPQDSLGKGRGIDSPLSGYISSSGNIFISQSGNSATVGRLTVLNSAFLPEKDIEITKIPEAEKFIPHKIAMAIDNKIYLTGLNSSKVLVIDQDGNFVKWFEIAVDKRGEYVFSTLDDSSEKTLIRDVKVDSQGNLFFLSEKTSKVYVFNKDENFLFSFGEKGGAEGKMSRPRAIAIDEKIRCIYLVDYMRHTVLIFDYEGKFRYEFGGRGWGPEWFNYPVDIVVGSQSQVVVADFFNQRAQVFDLKFKKEFPERPSELWKIIQ